MLPVPFHAQVDQIFREHHAWLHSRLLRRVSNRSDAEEVASETFLQLSEDGGRTDIRDPRAFLTTIAKRILFQQWRRQDLEQAYIDTMRHMPQAMALSPEEHAMLMGAIAQLDRALAALPLPVKTAFLLSRLDGWTYPQIARHLGLSQATVERHMKRAILQCVNCAA